MDIKCKASNMGCDVRCAVCGQSFLVYWTYLSPAQRTRQHAEVMAALRGHHASGTDAPNAHPAGKFTLPFVAASPMMFPPVTLGEALAAAA